MIRPRLFLYCNDNNASMSALSTVRRNRAIDVIRVSVVVITAPSSTLLCDVFLHSMPGKLSVSTLSPGAPIFPGRVRSCHIGHRPLGLVAMNGRHQAVRSFAPWDAPMLAMLRREIPAKFRVGILAHGLTTDYCARPKTDLAFATRFAGCRGGQATTQAR
jgi:hypothetical protein